MTIGIYCIEHVESGKKYIGKSKNIEIRMYKHKYYLQKETYSKECNRHLWSAVNKYGINSFKFYIIEQVIEDATRLAERELYWIDLFNSSDRHFGYNLLRASGGVFSHSDESKSLMRAATLLAMTPERRAQMSIARKGKRVSESTKALMSLVKSGIPKTESEKLNTSRSLLGVKHTSERRLASSIAHSKYSYHQYAKDETLLNIYLTRRELVEAGFCRVNVQAACRGKLKTYKGFVWKRVDILKLPACSNQENLK